VLTARPTMSTGTTRRATPPGTYKPRSRLHIAFGLPAHLDCLFGWGRRAVENSALCSVPNTQIGALPMQLADHVERKCNGQSATETTCASRRVQPSPGLALLPRFHQQRLAFVRIRPTTAFPEFSTTFQRRRISITNGNRIELTMPQPLPNAARMLPTGSRNLAR